MRACVCKGEGEGESKQAEKLRAYGMALPLKFIYVTTLKFY